MRELEGGALMDQPGFVEVTGLRNEREGMALWMPVLLAGREQKGKQPSDARRTRIWRAVCRHGSV